MTTATKTYDVTNLTAAGLEAFLDLSCDDTTGVDLSELPAHDLEVIAQLGGAAAEAVDRARAMAFVNSRSGWRVFPNAEKAQIVRVLRRIIETCRKESDIRWYEGIYCEEVAQMRAEASIERAEKAVALLKPLV